MTKRHRGMIKSAQPEKKKIAIGYTRVSTQKQVIEGQSLEQQGEALQRWCDVNGYTLLETFSDEGISAKKGKKRPGVEAAIAATIEYGATLVCYSLSRVSRSIDDLRGIVSKLEKSGSAFVSLKESFETQSASGKLMLNLLSAFAEYERELVSERTVDGLARKIERGERVSRHPRYGCKHVDGKLIPDAGERKVIALMARLRAKGMTFAQIAAELKKRAIVNRAGKTTWNPSTILYTIRKHTADQKGDAAACASRLIDR